MVDNSSIVYDIEVESKNAKNDFDAITKQVEQFTSRMVHAEGILDNLLRKAGNNARQRRAIIGEYSAGGSDKVNTQAAFSNIVAETTKSYKVLNDRFANTMANVAVQSIKALPEQINARLKLAEAQAKQQLLRSRPDVMNANSILAERDSANRIRRAEVGDRAYTIQNIRDRIGNFQFLGVQAEIMANYAALSAAYNMIGNVSSAITALDQEFKNLQAITGASNISMGLLSDTIFDLGNRTRFSTVDIAKAATVLGQAGLSANQTRQALEGITTLATAAGTDLASATDILTSTLTVFDISAEKTANVANTLTAALNASKLDIQKLGLGIQYAGNIAAESGIKLEELVAILGTLADSGVRGSTASTGVRQLILDLSNPSEKLQLVLKRLGLSLSDIDIKTNGFVGVLNNLKAAGFTSADAMNAFEVRAAAAFSALENNTQSIGRIEQSLNSTTAAAAAADKQMEGLSAQSQRLTNVLTSMAFKALTPSKDAVAALVSAMATGFDYVSKYTVAIEALGTALIALSTIKVGSYLVRFFDLGNTITSTVSAAMKLTGTTNLLGAALFAAGGQATFLGRALMFLMANPMVMGVAAVSALIAGIALWHTSQRDLNEELDKTQAKLETDTEVIDKNNQTIRQLNDSIEELNRTRSQLQKDTEMGGNAMTTKVSELKKAYGELGLELSGKVKPAVDDLIAALNNLKVDIQGKLPDAISAKLADLDAKIQILDQQLKQKSNVSNLPSNLQLAIFGGRGSPVTFEKRFGADARLAANMVTGSIAPPTNALDLNGLYGRLREQANAASGGNREILEALLTALRDLQTTLSQKNQLELEKKGGNQDLLNAQTAASMAPLGALTQALDGKVSAGLTSIEKSSLGLNPVDVTKKYKDFSDSVASELKSIDDKLEAARLELIKDGASPSEADEAVNATEIPTALAKIRSNLSAAVEGMAKDTAKVVKARLQREQANNSSEIARLVDRLRNAKMKDEVDIIRNEVMKQYDRKAEIAKEVFRLDNPNGADFATKEAFDAELSGIRSDEAQMSRDIAEKLKSIGEYGNKQYLEMLQQQADLVKSEIEAAKQGITTKSPAEAIKKMVDKVNELTDQLLHIYDQIGSLQLSANIPDMKPKVPSQQAGAIQRMIIEAANARGIDPQVALAIANMESGFNPMAKNPHSSAMGIYQMLNGTWNQMGVGRYDMRRFTPKGQIDTGLDYFLKNQQALTGFMGRTPGSSDMYLSHLLGLKGYQRALSNMDGNAIQVLGSKAVLGNGGNAGQSVADFVNQIRGIFGKKMDEVAGLTVESAKVSADAITADVDTKKNDAVKAAKEAADISDKAMANRSIATAKRVSKAIEADIANLGSQAKLLETPKNIQEMSDRIHKKFMDLLKNELDVFDKTNPGDIEGRTALIEQIKDREAQALATLHSKYLDAVEKSTSKPVDSLKRQLDQANKVGNNVLADELTRQLNTAEIEASKQRVLLLTQEQAAAEQRVAEAKKAVAEANQHGGDPSSAIKVEADANGQLVEVTERLNEAKRTQNDLTGDELRQQVRLPTVIQNTTRAWLRQQGVVYNLNGVIDENATNANQWADAWNGALSGIQSGFSQLLTDIADGNKSIGESAKDLVHSILKTFEDMFIKLAAQKLMQTLFGSLLGGVGGGGGGGLGSIISGMFESGSPASTMNTASAAQMVNHARMSEVTNTSSSAPQGKRVGQGGVVNVWVVSPDQVPPPGPGDIVAHVASNIRDRGVLKTMIKQVQMGY